MLKDLENVRRYQMGMRSLWVPWEVVTNELPRGNDSILSLFVATPEVRSKAENSSALLLDWLVHPWFKDGEYLDAVLAAMLLRRRGFSSMGAVVVLHELRQVTNIDAGVGANPQDDYNAVLDKLLALVGDQLRTAGS